MFVLAIFCILWYISLLNVAIYAFNFLFSYFNLQGVVPSLTQGGDKGMGRLTLCGPNEEMWTQVGEMMNGAIVNGRGVIVNGAIVWIRERDHAIKVGVSQVVPP